MSTTNDLTTGAKEGREGGNYHYLQISYGLMVEEVAEPTAKTKTRKITKGPRIGQDKHELFFESVTGKLTDVYLEDGQFGRNWKLKIDASTESNKEFWIVQIGVKTGYANSFLSKLKNLDLDKFIMIAPYSIPNKEKPGKTTDGVSIYQIATSSAVGKVVSDKIKVDNFFTLDGPNKTPQWRQIEVDGKMVWDMTEQLRFYEKMVNEEIKPKLSGASAPTSVSTSAAPTTFLASELDADTADDLPF